VHTTIAYQEAGKAAAGEDNIAGVPDQHVRVDGDVIYMSAINQIIGVYAGGSTLITGARLESPSLRRLANYEISPVEAQIEPFGDDAFIMHPLSPLPLEENEGLEALVRVSADASADLGFVAVFLSDGPVMSIEGEIFHVRATATVASVGAQLWENSEITFDETLPVGRYQLVGAEVIMADGMAFRFVPIGEAYRPGGMCITAHGSKSNELQRNGGLGIWCEFDQITPPSIEIISSETATATAVVMILDLIKIG